MRTPLDTSDKSVPASRRWLGVAALTLGVAMIIVDSTVLNVAVPSIIRDLQIDITTAQWANTIYSLVFAALLITFGSLADRIGRRRMFIIGVALFMLASLLAGQASTGGLLIAARTLQGVAGAIILPASLSTLNATFTGRDRAIAFGMWGAVIGGMVAIGPLLGGWCTTNLSWRWAFYINIPVGIAAITGVRAWVAETRDTEHVRGFDPAGVVLIGLGLASLVFATIEGNTYGWWPQRAQFSIGTWQWPDSLPSVIVFVYLAAALLLCAAAYNEVRRKRQGRSVILEFSLYSIPSFRNGNFAAMIVSLGELGLVFVLPLYLQTVRGYSAFDTGVLLLALSGGAFAAGGLAARLSMSRGPRSVVMLGFALEIIGIVSLGMIVDTDTSGWVMSPSLFIYGMGVGFATAQLTGIILADVPVRQSGLASGMQSTIRQVGAAMGIALLGSVFVLLLTTGARDELARVEAVPAVERGIVLRSIERTGGAVLGLSNITSDSGREAAREAIDDAFVHAARWTAFAAAGFVLLGLLAAAQIPSSAQVTSSKANKPDAEPDC